MPLTYTNNWEVLTYLWDGIPVTKIKFVTVRTPLGGEHTVPAKFVEKSRTVHDMGHTYTATTEVLYLKWELLGAWVPIERDDYLANIVGVHPAPRA